MHHAPHRHMAGAPQRQRGERPVTGERTRRLIGINAVADQSPQNGCSQQKGSARSEKKLHVGRRLLAAHQIPVRGVRSCTSVSMESQHSISQDNEN